MNLKAVSTALLSSLLVAGLLRGEEPTRNYGAVQPQPTADAVSTAGAVPVAHVAFGFGRRCCGYRTSYPLYGAYLTYQPGYYPSYAVGYGGNYAGGYTAGYVYSTPNPYGYYPNGWVWGSSGPTYTGPFPVWYSPSGVYDYRYRGWGSYGWGGWGGTGAAGWGYQGGVYW